MKIVLVTIGSLGDLHPFIAIGRSLVARGASVLLAVPADGVAKARAAGLNALPILPSYQTICDRLGQSHAQVAERIIADTNFVMDEILLPSLGDSVAALDSLAKDSDVIAGSIFAFATGIVAEKHGIPLVPIVLQPMTLFSSWQPPASKPFGIMRHAPRSSIGRAWNASLYRVIKAVLRRRYAARIDAVRLEYGLPSETAVPLFDHGATTAELLCCWSSVLGHLPPDAPCNAHQTGFPFFDEGEGAGLVQPPELSRFLDEGAAPVVFSLGSVVVEAAGAFYRDAAEACRIAGTRGVMLTGGNQLARQEGNCLYLGYAAHAQLLPHAAAIVHHGGIGTMGQALRAGCPQIVVPHFGDQFDNAERVTRRGLGLALERTNLRAQTLADGIHAVRTDAAIQSAVRNAALAVRAEDGADTAARRIMAIAERGRG